MNKIKGNEQYLCLYVSTINKRIKFILKQRISKLQIVFVCKEKDNLIHHAQKSYEINIYTLVSILYIALLSNK